MLPDKKKKKYRMATPKDVDDDADTDTGVVRQGADPDYVLDSAEQAAQRKKVKAAWRNSTDQNGGLFK